MIKYKVIQSSFTMSSFYNSLAFFRYSIEEDFNLITSPGNALNPGFCENDPWYLQSIHKALVVQEVFSCCGKTETLKMNINRIWNRLKETNLSPTQHQRFFLVLY